MKILYVTTIGGTMDFFISLIEKLIEEGNTIDIATNIKISSINDKYRELGCKIFDIDCTRSPSSAGNIKAIKQLKKIVFEGEYDIVHCHTPIAAAATRLACRKLRKNKTHPVKVIYTAHGFHFFKGAPLKNWLIYYPVEKICARMTDVLITINKEDYERAKRKLKAGKIEYVPGVGIDVARFSNNENAAEIKAKIREELGISKDTFMLLSVGELNDNKNHAAVIKAISGMDLTYVIVGKGENAGKLKELAREYNSKVILTGFRTDVADFYKAADAYILPSLREGLNVSLMEAMASGLPCLAGNIRGNVDLVDEEGGFTFEPSSSDDILDAIKKMILSDKTKMSEYNRSKILGFDYIKVNNIMKETYENL